MPGRDTYMRTYEKIMQFSQKYEGVLFHLGLDDEFAVELSHSIDEAVESIRTTLLFMKEHGLIVRETTT